MVLVVNGIGEDDAGDAWQWRARVQWLEARGLMSLSGGCVVFMERGIESVREDNESW